VAVDISVSTLRLSQRSDLRLLSIAAEDKDVSSTGLGYTSLVRQTSGLSIVVYPLLLVQCCAGQFMPATLLTLVVEH